MPPPNQSSSWHPTSPSRCLNRKPGVATLLLPLTSGYLLLEPLGAASQPSIHNLPPAAASAQTSLPAWMVASAAQHLGLASRVVPSHPASPQLPWQASPLRAGTAQLPQLSRGGTPRLDALCIGHTSARSCCPAFALAVPSAWNAPPPRPPAPHFSSGSRGAFGLELKHFFLFDAFQPFSSLSLSDPQHLCHFSDLIDPSPATVTLDCELLRGQGLLATHFDPWSLASVRSAVGEVAVVWGCPSPSDNRFWPIGVSYIGQSDWLRVATCCKPIRVLLGFVQVEVDRKT